MQTDNVAKVLHDPPSQAVDASGRARRRSYAQEQFRATPVASDFEAKFANRFYAYAEAGGSPQVDRFPKVLRRMRLSVWLAAAWLTVSLMAIPLFPAMAEQDPPLHWTQNAIAAWLASALLLVVPLTLAIVVSQRRFNRKLQDMNEDRAQYVSYMSRRHADDDVTARRLRELGIDL